MSKQFLGIGPSYAPGPGPEEDCLLCQLRCCEDAKAANDGLSLANSIGPKYEPGPISAGVGTFSPNSVVLADLVGIAIAPTLLPSQGCGIFRSLSLAVGADSKKRKCWRQKGVTVTFYRVSIRHIPLFNGRHSKISRICVVS